MERQREMADINAIGTSVQNFLALRNQAQDRALQMKDRELNNRFMEAKIKSMEPSELDNLMNKAKAYNELTPLANAGDQQAASLLDQIKNGPATTTNNNIDDFAKITPDAAMSANKSIIDRATMGNGLNDFGIPKYDREKYGGALTPEGETQKKMTETKMTQNIKDEASMGEGKRMALQNIDLVSGAINELSQTYADAYKEGGIGSRGKAIKSGVARWMGGEGAEKFPATSAFEGQKTEVVSRLMPLLTQQGDKPGSVRLVSTVFSKLEKTLPDEVTPPKNAKRMMEQTLRNMYRFARASQRLGLTNETVESASKADLEIMSEKVAQVAKSIEISGEEKEQLDSLLGESLSPVDEIINKKDRKLKTATPKDLRNLSEQELKALIGE